MLQNTKSTLILSNVETAKTTLTKAKNLLSQKNYEQAIPLLKKSLEVFEASEEWELFMEASYELVKAYQEDFLFSELEDTFDSVLKIQEEKCPHLFIWKARLYNEKGLGLIKEGKFGEALQSFKQAQQIMEKEEIGGHLFIQILISQISLYTITDKCSKAQELIEIVSELLKNEPHVDDYLIANFYISKGILEYRLAQYELAEQNYQKAYELYSIKHIDRKLHCYLKVAKMQGTLGDIEDEIKYYFEQSNVYKNSNNKLDKFLLAGVYLEMGRYYNNLGEFTQSLYYYKNALTLFEEVSSELSYWKSMSMSLIAILFFKQKNYVKQIDYYKRALKIKKNIFGKNNKDLGVLYFNLANAYININSLDKALKPAQKAFTIYRNLLGEKHDFVLDVEHLIGLIYTKKREFSKGLKYLNKALKGYQEKYEGHYYRGIYRKVSEFYRQISINFYQQGKLKTALKNCQLALRTLLSGYDETDFYHLPTIEQCPFTEFYYLSEILFEKANTLHDYFHILKEANPNEATNALKAGLDTCLLRIAYLHKAQKTLKTSESMLFFINIVKTYQLSIKIILCLKNHLKDDSILRQAFVFQEQAKGILLRSSMQEQKAKLQTAIDSKLLEQEKDLKNYIETSLQKIQGEEAKGAKKDKVQLKKLREEYLSYLQDHQKLIVQLEKDYPQYYALKYNFETISVTALQKDLQENTVVLSYFIGPEMGYIFVVTPDEYQVIPFEIPADFDQQIKDYLSSIHAQNFAEFTHQSYDLYCLLIQPIEDLIFDPFVQELRQLVILPSAALHYLPFETLISRPPETAIPAFHQLDYLLNKFQIQYHYSATLYHQSLKQGMENTASLNAPSKEDGIDFMGFAPIYTSDKEATQEALRNLASDYSRWATRSDALQDGTLTPLPFSEKEVQSIEALFAQKGMNGQSFLYNTATKDHFKTLATKAKYLHIAAHGLTNDEFPKLSGIVFHPTEDATEIHDSVLSMGEMYQLQLQADLVVLSSCESGIGTLAKGEGMMAMNRGFLHAGAKNVIYTLFKVLDKPSSELCEALFEGILEGKSYSEALRQAKLALIQREDVDPKSWSGFVLLGN